MKYIISVIFIISSLTVFSQIYIVQNNKGEIIEGALFYGSNKSFSSNKKGEIDLSTFSKDQKITVYHIAYKQKIIIKNELKKNIITLIQNTHKIKEIQIHSSLNTEENKTQIIKLNRNEIQQSLSKNPAEILEKSVGINIQKSQNGGGSPNIRGFEANRILLVVDGVKMNNTIYRSGHLQNILSIDPYTLENVSVLHGPSSIFYGSGALGGAIIMNTIDIKNIEKNKSFFNQQYESSSSSVTSNFHSIYKYKKVSFLSSISFKKLGNLKMGNNRFHGYLDWGKDTLVTSENEQLFSEYNQIDLTQKIHLQINEKTFLSINSQYSTTSNINRFDKLNDLIDNSPKYKNWYYGPQKRLLKSFNYNKKNKTYLFDKYNIKFSFQNLIESRNVQKSGDEYITERKENIKIYDSKVNFNKKIHLLKINYGISGRYEELNSTANLLNYNEELNFISTRYPDKGSVDMNYAPFLHTEIELSSKIKLYNAIRFDYNKISMCFSEENPFNLGDKLILINNDFSASSNVFYNTGNNNFLSFSFFNSFRNPNVDDIGKVFSKNQNVVVVPNLELKSEKIVSSELIWKHISKTTKIELVLFHSRLKDAIEKRDFSFNGQDSIIYDGEMMKCIANTNINSAIMNGLNIRIKQSITKNILFTSTSAFVKSISSDSLPLAHIPPLSIRSSLKYIFTDKSKITLYTNYNSWKRSSQYDINGVDNLEEATIDGTPSWITYNLVYSKKIQDLTISIACENILDSHYKTFASGISSSGRNFILNLQAEF